MLEFKSSNSTEDIDVLMSQRAGFAYINNPKLFTLDKFLSTSDRDDILKTAKKFSHDFYDKVPKQTKKSFLGLRLESRNLQFVQQDMLYLEQLIKDYENNLIDKGTFVTKFMGHVTELQETLHLNKSIRTIKALSDTVDDIITDIDNANQPTPNIHN